MRASGKGYELTTTAINGSELSRGTWSRSHFDFGQMVERASADVRLRPGDLLGSGTMGSGCLLEIRDETASAATSSRATRSASRSNGLASSTAPVVQRPMA